MDGVYAQITDANGLKNLYDTLRQQRVLLGTLKAVSSLSGNSLFHVIKRRDASPAKKVNWSVLGHLQILQLGFVRSHRGEGGTRRFHPAIYVVVLMTIQVFASCVEWAKLYRRRTSVKGPPMAQF